MMRVVGVGFGTPVALAEVEQGADPLEALLSQGWAARRPLYAQRAPDGEIELFCDVVPAQGNQPTVRGPGRDPELVIGDEEEVLVRQRVAAYAVVRSGRGILATQYSDKTSADGRWGLPGGGVDPGEEPSDAVAREIVEETSQHATIRELVEVQSNHWIGRVGSSARGTAEEGQLEDYHAIRLVYLADCPTPTDPVVIDVGGTTADARWVPADSWPELPWTPGWQALLTKIIHAHPLD